MQNLECQSSKARRNSKRILEQLTGLSIFHNPVMVREVIQYLAPKDGIILDATLGGGGHSEAILSVLENGFLVGIDLDPAAISYSQSRLVGYKNFRLFNCNFMEMDKVLEKVLILPECQNLRLMGVLFDLGVSLYQIRTPERGFSYQLNGPLNMSFNPFSQIKAIDVIRRSSLPKLEEILREFGEERYYRRIAKAIWLKRQRLSNTKELVNLIESCLLAKPRFIKQKAVQRTFQALRIATNNELDNLFKGLLTALELLSLGGRIVVLAYHSLEDRIVKNTFRLFARQGKLEILTKKPLRPTEKERHKNPYATSARLRAAIKIG
jgi:16S rRNA (cytosine1402-N4)-methyltransferase